MTEEVVAYYFGCWRRPGHYVWLPGMKSPDMRQWGSWYPPDLPWQSGIDGHLTPGVRNSRGRLSYEAMSGPHQSEAKLHHLGGWTALAMHDFTVDSRPGSNSAFFFNRKLDFLGAVDMATQLFPGVVARITASAPIREVVG